MATITIRISTTIVTYQWQMKGSRGSSLVHRPVILSGSQAEGVKKKEALEEVSLITSHGYDFGNINVLKKELRLTEQDSNPCQKVGPHPDIRSLT